MLSSTSFCFSPFGMLFFFYIAADYTWSAWDQMGAVDGYGLDGTGRACENRHASRRTFFDPPGRFRIPEMSLHHPT